MAASVITTGSPIAIEAPIDTSIISCQSISCSGTIAAGVVNSAGAVSGNTVGALGAIVAGTTITATGAVTGSSVLVNGGAGIGVAYDTVNLPATKYFYVANQPASINLPGFGNPAVLCGTYPVPAGAQNADLYEVRIPFTASSVSIGSGTDDQEVTFYLTNVLGGGPSGSSTQITLHIESTTPSGFQLVGALSPAVAASTQQPTTAYLKGGLVTLLFDAPATTLYLYAVATTATTGGNVLTSPNLSALITAYN